MDKNKLDTFLYEFCYSLLDPLMNNEIDLTTLTELNCKAELWDLFCEICK